MKIATLAIIAVLVLTGAANAQNEFGLGAGNDTMTGSSNTGIGHGALTNNTTGNNNTADGEGALYSNTEGYFNTASGWAALHSNTQGYFNTANGFGALYGNTTGNYNTANGDNALALNTTGIGNTASGDNALYSNTTGGYNTAIGGSALTFATGYYNIAIGYGAGASLTSGDNNIDIYDPGVANESSTIRIGTQGIQTNTFVAGISGVTVPHAASPVVVDSVSGQLGTVDINSLTGPAGPMGPQGVSGVNGVNGVGFVPGAYLYLPTATKAPAGFTKIGTKTDFITDLHGRLMVLKMNVYQKN